MTEENENYDESQLPTHISGWDRAAKSEAMTKVSVTSQTETADDEIDEISNPQSAMRENFEEKENSESVGVIEDVSTNELKIKPASRRRHRNSSLNARNNPTVWKMRKRGRRARVASVQEFTSPSFPPLPKKQFTTSLRRRAIRKAEDNETGSDPNYNSEDCGDISLGMKLIVVGGRVIVQSLNGLTDGRASPAQLTGMIERGDVLLAIGQVSLVLLPIDKLMDGLKPLSSPDANGNYMRSLELRFESGIGLGPLKSHEEAEVLKSKAFAGRQDDAANEMFSLFPMVDQLSGAPLFDEFQYQQQYYNITETTEKTEEEKSSGEQDEEDSVSDEIRSPDDIISAVLALETKLDRKRFTSEFYDWSDQVSELLKKVVEIAESSITNEAVVGLTQSERVDLGKNVMKIAKALSLSMEDMDKGKDMRSFKVWSSNFSLKSGASARRRFVLDTASLRSHRHQKPEIEEESEADESVGSDADNLESMGDVDGDALLLKLAAHDEIWQSQVVDFLKESIKEKDKKLDDEDEEKEDNSKEDIEEQNNTAPDINSALSKELGTFLFGENMAKIITKKKRSYALPPEEITTVLFDLTTNIATSTPDEITIFGQGSINQSLRSGYGTSLGGKAKSTHKTNTLLANQFVLYQALPFWLESFRPFPWEQRRVLWPRLTNLSSSMSGGATIVSDADSLTVESAGSSPSVLGTKSRIKDIREIIEDQELDIETRSETCFLVTYYFTQRMIAQYSVNDHGDTSYIDAEAVAFVKRYGAYLQLHSCLSCSAASKAVAPIKELLSLAHHDPTHRDAVREMKKGNVLTFYENGKLSALLLFLNSITNETKVHRREVIKSMCFSAYPDVQPWQVREACCSSSSKDRWTEAYYYSYLSTLLHPTEGNEEARDDSALVKEWCELSIGLESFGGNKSKSVDPERRKNFFSVTSRASSDHLSYRRDLQTLLKLSMAMEEHDLALDLVAEILESKALVARNNIPGLLLSYLKITGITALDIALDKTKKDAGFLLFKRVLKLFHQMSIDDSSYCRESVILADEIYALFQEWKSKSGASADDSKMMEVIDFVIKESSPTNVLPALILWSSEYQVGHSLFPRLDALLCGGVRDSLKSRHPSLFRLQQARQDYCTENQIIFSERKSDKAERSDDGIWRRMTNGELSINK